MTQFTFMPAVEAPELADDVRALFDDIAASLTPEQRAVSGECQPPLDVLETDRAVEIVVDLSGVGRAAVRVLFRANVVVVAGEKTAPPAAEGQAFHLVEREFGRFARAVRLSGAFDVANSRASIEDGELTIVLPKLVDRRGQAHEIRIA